MEKRYFMKMKIEEKEAGVAIYVPDKIDFKTNVIPRDKEGPSSPTSRYLSE